MTYVFINKKKEKDKISHPFLLAYIIIKYLKKGDPSIAGMSSNFKLFGSILFYTSLWNGFIREFNITRTIP